MGDALAPEELAQRVGIEIDWYDPVDAAKSTALVRARAGQAAAMHAIAEMCEAVSVEYDQIKTKADSQSEARDAAVYLERLSAQQAQLITQQLDMQGSTIAKLNNHLNRFPRLSEVLRPLARKLMH